MRFDQRVLAALQLVERRIKITERCPIIELLDHTARLFFIEAPHT